MAPRRARGDGRDSTQDRERGQRTAVEGHLIAAAAVGGGVAQLQDDDLLGHDVELVAAGARACR